MAEEEPWRSEGKCVFCNQTFSKRGVGRHLTACKARKAFYEQLAAKSKGAPERLFHLHIRDAFSGDYWLHVEIPARASLRDLDQFLRDIWLECCGHLSMFRIEGQDYFVTSEVARDLGGMSMAPKLGAVLRPRVEFQHEYDFGTTTDLVLTVVAERQGVAAETPVHVMARNDPPPIMCSVCGKAPARVLCIECIYDEEAWFCIQCGAKHECGMEMLLPVVNSPRMGMCGYTGEDTSCYDELLAAGADAEERWDVEL